MDFNSCSAAFAYLQRGILHPSKLLDYLFEVLVFSAHEKCLGYGFQALISQIVILPLYRIAKSCPS